jgi:F0F1-type ATP synthase delta subunit
MEKYNFDFIYKHIRTTEERNELVELIEEMLENNFRRDQEPLPKTPFSSTVANEIYEHIRLHGIENNRENIEKLLEKMLGEVKKLPEIRLTIAIPPSENLKNNLKTWADENGLRNVVFNIEVKTDITAGTIIMSHLGEYGNYSLSSQLDKYFNQKKQEILALL